MELLIQLGERAPLRRPFLHLVGELADLRPTGRRVQGHHLGEQRRLQRLADDEQLGHRRPRFAGQLGAGGDERAEVGADTPAPRALTRIDLPERLEHAKGLAELLPPHAELGHERRLAGQHGARLHIVGAETLREPHHKTVMTKLVRHVARLLWPSAGCTGAVRLASANRRERVNVTCRTRKRLSCGNAVATCMAIGSLSDEPWLLHRLRLPRVSTRSFDVQPAPPCPVRQGKGRCAS